MTRRSVVIPAVGVISALLLAIGIGLMVSQVFRTVMHNRLKKEIVLVEGSRVFESWKNPPPPVYMEFFFFNVTNDDMILAGAKPQLIQVGPYTYREYRYKDNVTMVENGTRVSAYNTKKFVFLREKSVGDPAVDLITTVNIPAWAVMTKVKGNWFKSAAVNTWMKLLKTPLFTTRTVDELLWGYEDSLLARAASSDRTVEKVFGLMYKKNGSNDGEMVFHTGAEDYMDYGRIDTWNGESKLKFWNSEESNKINGSDGSAFHPLLTKDERIFIFTPDLCRTIYMDFQKEVEVKGIPAYRFTPPRSVLASKEENPENTGFCVSPRECLGTGLLKVSPCRKGAPVVASFPHFHLADSKYVEAIEGMSPKMEHHQTFLDLNPTTGIIVRANKRAQVNLLIEKMLSFAATNKINQTIFPVMFINESVTIDDASAARVQKLLLISNLVPNFPYFIMGLGVIMIAIFIVLLIRSRKQKNEVNRIEFTKAVYTKSSEEDASYSRVNGKGKEDLGLVDKSEPQA